jgi:hypothetical protein
MKPRNLITWAGALTAIAFGACIGLCGMHEMLSMSFSPHGLLTPASLRTLLVLMLASLIATLVVCLSKVASGKFQFSGLGMDFKGFACEATIWVVVFVSFTAAYVAVLKCIAGVSG